VPVHADSSAAVEPPGLYTHRDPGEVVRSYLAEVTALVTESEVFEVLAHVDYSMRSWPATAGAFLPETFEEEFRPHVARDRPERTVLEVNTVVPFHATILRWWRAEGGDAVTFGSDAHDPTTVARGFRDAMHLAEARLQPRRAPYEVWGRA